jgi:hypothetical protein
MRQRTYGGVGSPAREGGLTRLPAFNSPQPSLFLNPQPLRRYTP